MVVVSLFYDFVMDKLIGIYICIFDFMEMVMVVFVCVFCGSLRVCGMLLGILRKSRKVVKLR